MIKNKPSRAEFVKLFSTDAPPMIDVLSEYGILKCYPFYNYRESFFKYEKYENRLKVVARYLEDTKDE